MKKNKQYISKTYTDIRKKKYSNYFQTQDGKTYNNILLQCKQLRSHKHPDFPESTHAVILASVITAMSMLQLTSNLSYLTLYFSSFSIKKLSLLVGDILWLIIKPSYFYSFIICMWLPLLPFGICTLVNHFFLVICSLLVIHFLTFFQLFWLCLCQPLVSCICFFANKPCCLH